MRRQPDYSKRDRPEVAKLRFSALDCVAADCTGNVDIASPNVEFISPPPASRVCSQHISEARKGKRRIAPASGVSPFVFLPSTLQTSASLSRISNPALRS